MAKVKRLFEYIVVEGEARAVAQRAVDDLSNTFEKKRHLFEETRKTFQPRDEGAAAVVEEQSDIQSDVMKELRWLASIVGPALDTAVGVQAGNALARADVEVDGRALLTGVPATGLLSIDKALGQFLNVLAKVPTLDPAKGFSLDPDRGERIYRARDVRKTRTKKVEKFVTVAAATEQHPAQVAKVTEDEPVGTIVEQAWSGLITPAQKSEMMFRCERLRGAVKQAIQRANAVEVSDLPTVAKQVFDFVLG